MPALGWGFSESPRTFLRRPCTQPPAVSRRHCAAGWESNAALPTRLGQQSCPGPCPLPAFNLVHQADAQRNCTRRFQFFSQEMKVILGRDRTGFLDGLWAPQVLFMTQKCQRTASEKPACPSNQGLNLKPTPGPAAGLPLQQSLVYQNCLKPAFSDFFLVFWWEGRGWDWFCLFFVIIQARDNGDLDY